MKKRVLSLLVICTMLLCMVLTISSCGDASRVNDAIESTRALKCLDADLLLDLRMEVNDKTLIGTDKNGKAQYTESWDSRTYAIAQKILETTLEDGTKIAQEKGGWYGDEDMFKSTYFDSSFAYLPNGTKQAIGEYKKYNTYYADLVRALLADLPQELFVENEDGGKKISLEEAGGITYVSSSFDMENDEESGYFERIFSQMLSAISDRACEYMDWSLCHAGKVSCTVCGSQAADCEGCTQMRSSCKTCKLTDIEFFDDGRIEYKLENGYVTEAQMEFDMEISVGEDKLYIDGRMKVIINNPGEELGIRFPNNYANYSLVAMPSRPTIAELLK